ncbi:Inosine-5'-monophosphate dehydrogenase [subsurface metagenome]|nr:MAG: inosine-5-monophosphate dehydrogenase [Hadesarchaea archaeon B3_Hades]
MQVKGVMTKEVKWVEVPGTRAEALDILRKIGASAVPVVKRGTDELVGMVRLRKLFENPSENQLAMLVDRDVSTVSINDKLEEAVNCLLKARVRRLPVLKDGKLVGMLTVQDIIYRAIAEMDVERLASDFMRPHIIAVWDGTPIKAVVEIMDLSGFRALPAIDEGGNLVGIIDDSDILKVSGVETESRMSQMAGRSEGDSWTWDSENRIYITKRELKVPDKLVRDVMTKELVTITRKTTVSRAAQLMRQHRIEQTPILSAEGKLTGIVQDVDLLRALVE